MALTEEQSQALSRIKARLEELKNSEDLQVDASAANLTSERLGYRLGEAAEDLATDTLTAVEDFLNSLT